MLIVKRFATFGVGLLLLGAFVVAIAPPEQAHGAGSAPVTIQNTPLPVAMSGPVSGTMLAQQSGEWHVGLTGTPTVTVGNPVEISGSVPIRNASGTALLVEPQESPGFTIGLNTAGGTPIYTYPADRAKQMVIEYVNGSLTGGAIAPAVILFVGPSAGNHRAFYFRPVNDVAATGGRWYVNQATKIYVNPGEEVVFNFADEGIDANFALSAR